MRWFFWRHRSLSTPLALYYANFRQTTDEEVIELLTKAREVWAGSSGPRSGRLSLGDYEE
jgi:hypothetical protein